MTSPGSTHDSLEWMDAVNAQGPTFIMVGVFGHADEDEHLLGGCLDMGKHGDGLENGVLFIEEGHNCFILASI
jgi:hypothetical protein